LRNAADHGARDDADLTVTVGALPDGFCVEDDGEGIPAAERERVQESGDSFSPDGTGFGLAIVGEVADAHGWEMTVAGGSAGGARFEFTDGGR